MDQGCHARRPPRGGSTSTRGRDSAAEPDAGTRWGAALRSRQAPGVLIRPEVPADHAAIAQVVTAAFGSPAEAVLVERIRASPEHHPAYALVAELDGRVVGHVMVSDVALRLDDDGSERAILSLSPLAVAPDVHGRGIGSALVREVVRRVDADGHPLIVLEGSPAYYGRFGFEDSRSHGIHLHLPDWAPPEAGQVLRLAADDPAIRGEVVYPPAFDHLPT
jgi:putative acetyltransferase